MTFIVRQIAVTADGREIIRANPYADESIVIGRSAENAIHLPDLAVNPEHAEVVRRDDDHIIIKSLSGQGLHARWQAAGSKSPLIRPRGGELGFGGHVITVSEEDEGVIFTVKRVEALSDSAEARSESTVYTLKGIAPEQAA